MNLSEFILKTPELNSAKEIVFFGGSFNPWHEGHSSCVRLLPANLPLVVLPDHNPQKELSTDRLTNIPQIISNLSQLRSKTYLFEGFYSANRKNPTYEWIKTLKNSFSEKSFSLLMGFDSFQSIEKWIEAKRLLHLLSTIYIVSRMEDQNKAHTQADHIQKLAPNLNLIFLGHHPHENTSSTAIRDSK